MSNHLGSRGKSQGKGGRHDVPDHSVLARSGQLAAVLEQLPLVLLGEGIKGTGKVCDSETTATRRIDGREGLGRNEG